MQKKKLIKYLFICRVRMPPTNGADKLSLLTKRIGGAS